ncbi:30644_t:CDS:2, partial [Racocetra persica]
SIDKRRMSQHPKDSLPSKVMEEQNSDDGIIMEERTEPLRDKSPKPEPKPDDSDEKPEEEETKPKPEPEEKIEPEKDRPN